MRVSKFVMGRRAAVWASARPLACRCCQGRRSAQDFPSRAISIVVPFGPGTGNDIIARQVGQHMTATLGQSVIIDNRPGATGNIASDYVAKSQPNGYTIYLPSTSILLNQLVGTPNSNLVRDFEPVALSGTLPYALAVPAALPAQMSSNWWRSPDRSPAS